MVRLIHGLLYIVLLSNIATTVCVAQDAADSQAEESRTPAEQILGKWVHYRDTPNGKIKTVKDHRGDHSILTVYGPNGQKLYSHRSEYEVDVSGPSNVFRYRNKVVLSGPDAGEKDPKESAYIFRIEGDRFLELHGMLRSDRGKPALKVWKRLPKETQEKKQTGQRTV